MIRQGGPNNNRRPRSRHPGGGNGGAPYNVPGPRNYVSDQRPRSASSLRHQVFDSNGPEVRVRGNAEQVHARYQQLARDATTAGDRVAAESYLQYAEHYYRICEAINEATIAEQRAHAPTSPPLPGTMPPGAPSGGGRGMGDSPEGRMRESSLPPAVSTFSSPPSGGGEGSPFGAPSEREETSFRTGSPNDPFFSAGDDDSSSSLAEPLVARR